MKLPGVQFTVRMVAALTFVAIAFGLVFSASRHRWLAARSSGLQASCYSSLNNIAIALYNHSEANGRFPPPFQADERGVRMHSWRPLLLRWFPLTYPQASLYDTQERWDGAGNRRLDRRAGVLAMPFGVGREPVRLAFRHG